MSLAVLQGCGDVCLLCDDIGKELDRAVLIDYDQVRNFRSFKFSKPIYGQNLWWNGVQGFALRTYDDRISGTWVTFIICNLRNEEKHAEVFRADLRKFYVEYEGKRHYYEPLRPGTYSSLPDGSLAVDGNPTLDAIAKAFRNETQLGPDATEFKPGFYPAVNYRISIYVTHDWLRPVPGPTESFKLWYDGYPVLLTSRGQSPEREIPDTPTTSADLPVVCRPPAEA